MLVVPYDGYRTYLLVIAREAKAVDEPKVPDSQILIYGDAAGAVRIDVRLYIEIARQIWNSKRLLDELKA